MLTQAEQEAVAWVIGERPMEYEGRTRPANKPFHIWAANAAYWKANPGKPATIEKGDTAGVASWNRIHVAVMDELQKLLKPLLNTAKQSWPLVSPPALWGGGAKFETKRPAAASEPQTRYHAGVDLAASQGDPVLAPEAGTIIGVDVGWEAPTKATILQTDSGETLVLAGVGKGTSPPVGTRVEAGDIVARVTAYPKGSTMLHFQRYRFDETPKVSAVQAQFQWKKGSAKPKNLVDPTDYLTIAGQNTPVMKEDAAFAGLGMAIDVPGEDEDSEGEKEDDGTVASPGSGVGVAIGAVVVLAVLAAVFVGGR